MNCWSLPENLTRTGASHLRRGVGCQDASRSKKLLDRSDQPVQIMVVADGHGGQRYTHSEVGSRLACELALKLLADQFSECSSTKEVGIEHWKRWLVETFPNSLHQQWLASVEQHWQQEITKKNATEQPFSPIPYGTTLGVVIMTPTWWGHTGLGDWDLVRVGSAGDVALVNEEQEESQTGGEATYSLCLSNASSHFAARTAVYPITEQTPSFSLLLCTDGVRKSCSTDEDFFAIAKYLCEGDQPRASETANELNSDLDRISSEGSGDDVSVAIGRWLSTDKAIGKSAAPTQNQRLQRNRAVIVQPRDVNGDRCTSTTEPVTCSLSDDGAANSSSSKQLGSDRKPLLLLIVGLVILSAAGIAFNLLRGGPGGGVGNATGNHEQTLELETVLQQEADALCDLNQPAISIRGFDQRPVSGLYDFDVNAGDQPAGSDSLQPYNQNIPNRREIPRDQETTNKSYFNEDLLAATIYQRKSTFEGLLDQSKQQNNFFSKPSSDPLGALIVWCF